MQVKAVSQYLRKPGLETEKWRDIEDEDKMKEFEADMQGDLQAIGSYLD